MKLKLSIIALISITLFGAGIKIVLACADIGTPYDNYVSFFQNNITAAPQYKPFYYIDFLTFYDNWYTTEDIPEDDVLQDANIDEWYHYCKKAAKRADIDSFMNTFSAKDVIGLLDNPSGLQAKVRENSFCKFILTEKNKEVYRYLLFAKKCEPFNSTAEFYWDEKTQSNLTAEKDSVTQTQLIDEGVRMNAATTNDFLKWRYAYQAIRMAFYMHDCGKTLQLYEQMLHNKTARNVMYPRCIELKAGALYHIGKKKEAAYLYSKAFDLNDNLKGSAYQSFLWATDSIKMAALQPMCKNNHEKAVLVVMDGLYEKSGEGFEGLKLMQKAYALDPGVKGLDIIMTREINKAEQRYFQKKEFIERDLDKGSCFYSYYSDIYERDKKDWEKVKSKYTAYLDELNLFAQKMAPGPKTTDKAFWLLASSYIYFIRDNFGECKKYLELAGKEKMNQHEHDVHDVINILCIVHKGEKLTPETETELLPSLKWVEKREYQSKRFKKAYKDLLATILTDKYMDQKDTVRALFCLARANRNDMGGFSVSGDFTDIPGGLLENMSLDRFREVEAFVNKNDKSDFEKWLTLKNQYPLATLKELEGTKFIREMKFENAIAALSSVPKRDLQSRLPDFLIGHLQDTQDWNASDSANTYTKLEFAKKMLALEKKLEQDPRNARAAYQYANGLYSMSYYGKACHAFAYYRSTYDEYGYFASPARNKLPGFKKEFYSVSKALTYYLQASNNSSDREFKARCLFMAAKCWQKSCPVRGAHDRFSSYNNDDYYFNSLRNPYFSKLLKGYKNTSFYTDAFTSCSYLRDYARFN